MTTDQTDTAQHTPGRVHVDHNSFGNAYIVAEDGWQLAHVKPRTPDSSACPVREANARRIAACWNAHDDLLAGLRHFIAPFGHTFTPDSCGACASAWQAFQKAEAQS
jgi:hypothetical protein